MMQSSRPPPPMVPPVVHRGIRYEQVKNAIALGYDQLTGYLAAFDEKSGTRLWLLKVYDVKSDTKMEADVQWVYFQRMELVSGKDQLLIENEAHQKFIVDLKDKAVWPTR